MVAINVEMGVARNRLYWVFRMLTHMHNVELKCHCVALSLKCVVQNQTASDCMTEEITLRSNNSIYG